MKRIGSRCAGAAALIGLGAFANAGTLTLTGLDPLSGTAVIGGTHFNGALTVGFYDSVETSLGSIKSVCADLDKSISIGQSWPDTIWNTSTYVPNPLIQYAGNMVAADFNSVTTPDQAVGLQLDIWELLYDGPGGSVPDFATGNFTATGMTAAAQTAANSYWQDRLTPGTALFIRAEDGFGQDQITPVPEPASIALLGIGFAAILRRRRRRR